LNWSVLHRQRRQHLILLQFLLHPNHHRHRRLLHCFHYHLLGLRLDYMNLNYQLHPYRHNLYQYRRHRHLNHQRRRLILYLVR
jgi:hypothetical protein